MTATDHPSAAWAALGASVVAVAHMAEVLEAGMHPAVRLGTVLALLLLVAVLFWPLRAQAARPKRPDLPEQMTTHARPCPRPCPKRPAC